MKKRKDKYDRAIEYLTKHPEKIITAWLLHVQLANRLFQRCGEGCGCLTQIRSHTHSAASAKLTKEIRADKRIPARPNHIKVSDLPVFAEWQRRLDKELNRK